MIEARRLILPLAEALIPVPAQPQAGICSICHSSAGPGYSVCAGCHSAARISPPEILPVTLSVHGGLVHDHLWGYKESSNPKVRSRMALRLAALLALFIDHHAHCIGAWDSVTCVPSAQRVALEPVVKLVPSLAAHHQRLLQARTDSRRSLDPAQFTVKGSLQGRTVLLLDDTFTSGAKLFSAAASLRNSGATVAGPVVIGRHIQRSWPDSSELLTWLEKRPWDATRCARCAGEHRGETLF